MTAESVYDRRYTGDYREHLAGYEIARWEALDHFITRVLKLSSVRTVLDYGAGSGLHVGLWEHIFRGAELHFCDISPVGMEKFKAKYPRHADRYRLLDEKPTRCRETAFDVIVSVEVMEHVASLDVYVDDIRRLLKPGGCFIWTTPCGNHCSIEHIYSALTGKIERTSEGCRRWSWEDPTHVRRLQSKEVEGLLRKNGFTDITVRFRAHFFSFICTHVRMRRIRHLRNRLMTLDYALFRRLPNGASMLGGAKKPLHP